GNKAQRLKLEPGGGSVGDEAEEVVAGHLVPSLEEGELHQGGDPDDLASQTLDQPGRGPGRPAGGQNVVHDEDPVSGGDGVLVDLEHGRAVLELVLLALAVPGELAFLAHRDEASTEVIGDGRSEDEPASLDAHDFVD